MITLTAKADYGQSGQYVARITGRSAKYTFERGFVGHKTGKRNDYTEADLDEPGLYEICDVTRKGKDWTYCLLVEAEGTLRKLYTDKEDAMKIAKALDAGRPLEEIVRVRSKPSDTDPTKLRWVYSIMTAAESAKAKAAESLDTAVAACWNILEALPADQAKKVLASLKTKLTPPKAVEAVEAVEPAVTMPEAQS